MKIFILYAKENWITDELAKEWITHNKEYYTTDINSCDIIWILSNYIYNQIPLHIYKQKKVIITIHHIVPEKINQQTIKHYQNLDNIANVFLTNQDICKSTLDNYNLVTKPIKIIPLWHNENIWKNIANKSLLREKYNLEKDQFLVGSFQRDTEGNSLANKTFLPKLEKGPDIFVKAVVLLKQKYPNLRVLLTGLRRQYIMRELQKHQIEYVYFEMCDFNQLNELYQCLDLYIVGSRVEGGPRAINECSLLKIPLLTTRVGIAELLCHPDSIFNMNNIETILKCTTNTEHNYQQAQKYTIQNYMKEFTQQLLTFI